MTRKNFFLLTVAGLLFSLILPLHSMNTDEFLLTEKAKMRNDPVTAYELLGIISNQLIQDPEFDELNWLHAAMLYFIGDYYATNFNKKKELFTMTKDYSLKATKLNDVSADAHYWLAVGYGKWSEANGILDSLFYADDILNECNRAIELRPEMFYGIAFAIRAKVYDFAPGWPLSVGNKEFAYRDIKKAIEIGPNFRFNYQMYAEMLINDGMNEDALNVIRKGLSLPLDKRYPREEEKIISDLNKDLETVKYRLNME